MALAASNVAHVVPQGGERFEADYVAEAVRAHVSRTTYQAYQILHVAFVVAPVVAGIDKFFHFLVNWDAYLLPSVPQVLHMSAHRIMLGVGLVEILAGLIVAVAPRIGGWIVGLWLLGIVMNLLMLGNYYDVALRDFGLALASFALARLSVEYSRW
jgi:hypothetical protein